MKGDITFKILESLEKFALGATDLFEVFLEAGYGASIGNLEYRLRKKETERAREEERRRIAQNYYVMLSQLKKEGFIKTTDTENSQLLSLTSTGRKRLSFFRAKRKESPRVSQAQTCPTFVIIAFDIPEREKKKRNWLRRSLRHMGLFMLQKSVWMGNVKLPEDFIESLRNLKLVDHVEIFEITKTGTLKHIA